MEETDLELFRRVTDQEIARRMKDKDFQKNNPEVYQEYRLNKLKEDYNYLAQLAWETYVDRIGAKAYASTWEKLSDKHKLAWMEVAESLSAEKLLTLKE